ncbi:uncharacterized protein LOC109863121, partial [Pseudomyrmex gracilis]|uniref:uncharacterized protein LOC109863121 n=1 Tax=Pseudomyrmex gracilis TaxID=219809 RepID=UPI0009957D08
MKKKQIPQHQLIAIQEIIKTTKHKNLKGRRYNKEWILLCMLMHMKSPKAYNFLRDNQILPVPCVRTIQRYLSLIDSSCGFDMRFFEMFKLALDKKEEIQKHGVILLDEIHLRESVNVNSKNLTYTGLIDFGSENIRPINLDETADHGLVIMFQPLADFYSQPIAVFASKGSVVGEVLAQLIIKAIALLENINVKVHGIITDGAATNRKFWDTLGVQ